MIKTQELNIDLGGKEMKIKIVQNSEEVLVEAINEEETPVWVELWPSALALARWLWHGPNLKGQTVLELGCGLGLPGVVAAMKEAEVLQTDYIPEALKLAKETAALNRVSGLRTAVADWRSFKIHETFDLIIGSDILYHPDLNPCLKKIFQHNLRPGGRIIMGEAGRVDALAFVRQLQSEGWPITEERIDVQQGRFEFKTHLFQIQPPVTL